MIVKLISETFSQRLVSKQWPRGKTADSSSLYISPLYHPLSHYRVIVSLSYPLPFFFSSLSFVFIDSLPARFILIVCLLTSPSKALPIYYAICLLSSLHEKEEGSFFTAAHARPLTPSPPWTPFVYTPYLVCGQEV